MPSEPSRIAPGFAQRVSQIEGPRPSSVLAPSIWKDAVAAPQTKPSGNWRVLTVDCLLAARGAA